ADSRAEGGWLIEQALSRAPRDGRNNSGFWLALQLRDNGYGEGEAERALLDYQARCPQTNTKGQREPYTVEDARKSLRAAYSHAPRAPIERGYGRGVPAAEPPSPAPPPAEPEPAPEAKTKFNRTDLGNAERFECRNRANVHYSKVMDRWFIWDGKRFQPDEKLAVVRLAADTVRSIYREAAKEGDDEERRRLIKHAMASESRGALSALVDLARSRPRIAIAPSELDADPLLLNCDNGTLDLQTGELREHRKADLITKLIPIPYHPQAACPYWIEFLHLIMAGDEELVKFLQRAVGYSLSGDVSERVLFFCHGSGRNGKSTFLETVHLLTGDYGMKTPSETLMYKREGGINNDVARLKGARYVYASETQEGGRLNEEQAKNLTGEAVLSARFLYSEIFEFRREFKLWLASNHLPSIHGGDKGIWDRIRKIPFQVRIPDDKLIKRAEIDARFRAELPGILAWAVAGCREYLARGLQAPAAVMAATAAYQADMDVLGQFLDERCVVNPQLRSKAKELYEDYKKWTEERGEKYPMKQTAFGLRLAERGFEKGHTDRGNVYYGLGLAAEGFEGFGGDFDKTARSTPAEKSYAGNRLNPSNPSASEENKATYAPEEEVIV
ncbi:MAG: phage/plasmid primase, P4 family, partial [bacterium]